MKIEWAPLKVPLKRRMETLVTGLFAPFFIALPLNSAIAAILIMYFAGFMIRSLLIIYIAYIYMEHKRNYSAMDGNGWLLNRSNIIFRLYRDYFPVKLVKTAELPPNRNYIIACFPHGILGTGTVINMCLEISEWLKLFPKVRPKLGTLNQHFVTPFVRDLLRWWGLVSVSKGSLFYYLTKSNDPKHPDNRDGFTSNAVGILVGGAQEALDSRPGKYIFTLKNRKGFVKMAIRTGSSIVPSISFGEVDIFDQVDNPPDSPLRRRQIMIKKWTGISPVLPLGRSYLNRFLVFVPFRRPITQVVGAPIDVVQSEQPDPAYVDELHGKVMEALERLFEEHKVKYLENATDTHLVIS